MIRGSLMAGQTVADRATHRCDDRAMTEIQTAHTADLAPATLAAARALLDEVFADDPLGEHDWEHALGGIHALAWAEGALVGHASVVQRRLLHAGRALRTGYVEGVGERAEVVGAADDVLERGHERGHGAALMTALEHVIRGAYDLGALGATDDAVALYEGRGWRRWEGPSSALTPRGIVRTPAEDGAIWVLPGTAALDLAGELTCDWRDGDVW